MDALLDQINVVAGAGGQELLLLGLIFVAVFLAILGVVSLVGGRDSLKRRVGADGQGGPPSADARSTSISVSTGTGELGKWLSPLGRRLIPTDLRDVSALRRRLVQAGYLQPSAVGLYYVLRVVFAIGLPGAFLLMLPFLSVPAASVLPVAAALGILGLYVPNVWVDFRTRSLKRQYQESFPDALDLLVVCVEAGLGLDAAINRVSQELGHAHRALGQQLMLMSTELRIGKTREEALRNLAERLGIDEASSLVRLLLQSEQLGTSIAEALRVYSDEMRDKRIMRAEEKAHALPVKLAIPLALFVFPTIMIVIMFPAVVKILSSMSAV